MDNYVLGSMVFGGTALVSCAGLMLVRKLVPYDRLSSNHEVAGYMLSVVGTMYAVLLGLIVVDAMQKFSTGYDICEREANSLADIYILAEKFPLSYAEPVRQLCKTYADLVVEQEWPLMDDGKVCTNARRTAIALVRAVTHYEPQTEAEKAIFPIMVQEVCEVWDNRRARTNMSEHGVPAVEWIVLIAGGVVTVAFTYFFGMKDVWAQVIMTAMTTALIALNLFLVLLFGYPFSGDLKVHPDALELDRRIFTEQQYMHINDLKVKR